jgi:hypothetical protein
MTFNVAFIGKNDVFIGGKSACGFGILCAASSGGTGPVGDKSVIFTFHVPSRL